VVLEAAAERAVRVKSERPSSSSDKTAASDARAARNGAPGATAAAPAGPSEATASELLAELRAQANASLDDLTEAIIGWAQAAFGTGEILTAQEQFFSEMGKSFSDDSFFDARMSYFFDWFVYERPIAGAHGQATYGGPTPYAAFCRQVEAKGIELPEATARRLAGLGQFRHSVFEIAKVQETSMIVTDLIQGGKISVTSKGNEIYRGLEKKNIFQGFLFELGDLNHISQGLVLHPQRVAGQIKKRLKVAKKSPEFAAKAELSRLASTQMRHLRHRHVDPKTIYQAGLAP
jgi:hypothetical protein